MEDDIEHAIKRAIATMHENLGEPLTIDDMARAAMYSKFHFSRAFQRVTGVSPGRFLSAIRLQEAKRLLVSTSLTVTEISHRVGYASVGTFGSRFMASVGVSPTAYRELGGFTRVIRMDTGRHTGDLPFSTVQGDIWSPHMDQLGLIFVGLFPNRIPQGRPISCTVLHQPGQFVLDKVPPGTWYLLAHSVPATRREVLTSDSELAVGINGPIEVEPDTLLQSVDVKLRPIRALDPPVLMALLDVRAVLLGERTPPSADLEAETMSERAG